MFKQVEFMKDFISCETLSDVDCRILIAKYRQGDSSALEILIKGFSKMVISFIPYNQRLLDSASDRYQNGVMGIIRAANEFDLNSEVKFSTYAFVAIRRWMTKQSHFIQLPSTLWKAAKKYEAIIRNRSNHITEDFLCDQLMVSPKELKIIKSAFHLLYVEDIENASSYKMNSFEDDISDYVVTKLDAELLYKEIECLKDKRQIEIVKLYLGIGHESQTFKEIGEKYGISKQRVYVIYKKALATLKQQENIIELAREYL